MEAARECIAYRAKNATMLHLVAERGSMAPLVKHEAIARSCVVGYHAESNLGEPVYIVRAGLCAPHELFRDGSVTTADFLEWLMAAKEVAFRRCDELTRKTRRLVKCISVVDLANVTLAMATESRYQRTIGESGKLSEVVYPQLLERSIIINPPRFFYAVFGLFKPFMSPKVLAKMALCPGPGDGRGDSARGCPYASTRFDDSALPSFLGGTCKCVSLGGCIAGVPNECCAPPAGAAADGAETTLSVGAGACHELLIAAKTAGCKLIWNFTLADKGLEFSATLAPEAGPPLALVRPTKYRKEDGAVSGAAALPCAGTVRVRFDNSHSRFTSKTITFAVAVVPPATEGGGADGVTTAAGAEGNAAAADVAAALESMPASGEAATDVQ